MLTASKFRGVGLIQRRCIPWQSANGCWVQSNVSSHPSGTKVGQKGGAYPGAISFSPRRPVSPTRQPLVLIPIQHLRSNVSLSYLLDCTPRRVQDERYSSGSPFRTPNLGPSARRQGVEQLLAGGNPGRRLKPTQPSLMVN